jgi:ABC-2 type transport system permease protein
LPSVSHKFVYIFVNYFLINLFLLIPIFSASILSANSFVGEKERRTLESLLFAPISIQELFVGKVLASFLPSAFISFFSFILCGIVVNLFAYSMFDEIIFPSSNWLIMIFWLVPMLTIFSILLNLFISARVKSFQEAQQLGGMIVIPVIALLIGQVSGIVFLGTGLMLLIGGVLFIINLLFLHQLAKKNNRQVLFEKQIH